MAGCSIQLLQIRLRALNLSLVILISGFRAPADLMGIDAI
jgi:hypothetical protein